MLVSAVYLHRRCCGTRLWLQLSVCIFLFVIWLPTAVIYFRPLQRRVPLLGGFGFYSANQSQGVGAAGGLRMLQSANGASWDCPMKQLPLGLKAPCSSMAISPATFLYIVMGDGFPKESWMNRSEWENVSLLYTSWKVDVTAKLQPRLGETFRSTFYPNSTWTTGRNHQLQEAYQWEMDQGWKFEFFIFFDEDVFLSYRQKDDPHMVIVEDNDDYPMHLFNQLLIRDRPMRAGIVFNNDPGNQDPFNWTLRNFPCVRRCQIDNLVFAVHRTSVEFLLPYSAKFDNATWWASAGISNLLASSLVPDLCNQYREVLVEVGPRQQHRNYPRDMKVFYNTYSFTAACLNASNYADHRTADPKVVWERTMLGTGVAVPEIREKQCVRHPAGVDFARLLVGNLTNWPVVCV
eukprot:scpid70342/ scgid7726/ 